MCYCCILYCDILFQVRVCMCVYSSSANIYDFYILSLLFLQMTSSTAMLDNKAVYSTTYLETFSFSFATMVFNQRSPTRCNQSN